jgi:hypothetical protein
VTRALLCPANHRLFGKNINRRPILTQFGNKARDEVGSKEENREAIIFSLRGCYKFFLG